MPFNYEAVRELREREGLSHSDLVKLLEMCAKVNGLEKTRIDQTFISKLENGLAGASFNTVDLFYMVANNHGHKDLEFYKKPGPLVLDY